jgi:hypothetical protein
MGKKVVILFFYLQELVCLVSKICSKFVVCLGALLHRKDSRQLVTDGRLGVAEVQR